MVATPEKKRENALVDVLLDLARNLKNAAAYIEANDLHVDHLLGDACSRLGACRRFAHLFRSSNGGRYDPSQLLREVSGQVSASDTPHGGDFYQLYRGDSVQIRECLSVVMDSIDVQGARALSIAYIASDHSHFALGIPSGGRFKETLSLDGHFRMEADDLEDRWSVATGGGAVQWSSNSVELYLEGDSPIPSSSENFREAGQLLEEAGKKLEPWRGAIGTFEEGFGTADETKRIYGDAVAIALEHVQRAMEVMV